MSIHIGANGVVRALKAIDVGHHWGIYGTAVVKCGIDGVVRNLLDFADTIDHIEIELNSISVDTINTDGEYVSTDGDDLSTLNKYGSISVGTNNVQISCTTAKKQIYISYWIFVVYKDGVKAYLSNLLDTNGITYTLSVTGYEYFSTDGWYQSFCLGSEVISGHVSSSNTKTTTYTDVENQTSGWLMTSLKYSGTSRSKQTFNSITINGKSFPITVVNNLT